MVPTMIGMLLTHPEFRPERLALADAAHLRRVADAGGAARASCSTLFPDLDIYQGYGMTECVGGAHRPRPRRAPRRRRASCARPGARCPASCSRSRTPTATRCPRARPARSAPGPATSCASTGTSPRPPRRSFRDGWYHTGDAGYLDDEGYLFLVDRVKDMIVTGGENVYSVEVENAIVQPPGRRPGRGDRHPPRDVGRGVHAIVVLVEGVDATEDEIIEHRQRVDRRLQGAEVGGVPRRAAAALGRDEGAEEGPAGPVLGGPGAGGQLSPIQR